MSSSNNGAFAWTSGKSNPDDAAATPEAWQATRAHPPLDAKSVPDEWQPTRALTPSARPPALPDAWQSTRAQTALATQFLKDEEEYLTGEKTDIGRQTEAIS